MGKSYGEITLYSTPPWTKNCITIKEGDNGYWRQFLSFLEKLLQEQQWKLLAAYSKYNCVLGNFNKIKWFNLDCLVQGSGNNRLWVKSGLPSVFINKFIWEYSHAHSFVYCPWLLLHYKSRVEQLQQRPEIFTNLPVYPKSLPVPALDSSIWICKFKWIHSFL